MKFCISREGGSEREGWEDERERNDKLKEEEEGMAESEKRRDE